MRTVIHSLSCLFLFSAGTAIFAAPQRGNDPFLAFIGETVGRIPPAEARAYRIPTGPELDEWTQVLRDFRAGRYDECRTALARLGYSLTTVSDPATGGSYDIFREEGPVRRGWGTLIHNRGGKKRLIVHVNHPVEDGNAPVVAAELLRRAGARWMLMGGSAKKASADGAAADPAAAPVSVFQRWHELLSDASTVSLSLHGFDPRRYGRPISVSDVILSNGRTSDAQWGISRLSLEFRDRLRGGGFQAAVAMLDSGFARLAGGGNPQGIASNDASGFGRWLNVELSPTVRHHPAAYGRFIEIADEALASTQGPLARAAGDPFGLVSPRVIRIDRQNPLHFPPPKEERYRIVSFSAGESRNDTLDLLFGDWLEGRRSGARGARIVEYDTAGSISSYHGRNGGSMAGSTVTKLLNATQGRTPGIRPAEHRPADSADAAGGGEPAVEPIQVHRIPLRPVLASTVSPERTPISTPFHWGGMVPEAFTPQFFTFRGDEPAAAEFEIPGLSRFLIPLLKNSYHPGSRRYVGVDMTDMLVNEIARLVSEYRIEGSEIGLMAEQSESGDYYLRIFPEGAADEAVTHHP